MNTILFVEVSLRGKESAGRAVADTLVAWLTDLYPSAKVILPSICAIWTTRAH